MGMLCNGFYHLTRLCYSTIQFEMASQRWFPAECSLVITFFTSRFFAQVFNIYFLHNLFRAKFASSLVNKYLCNAHNYLLYYNRDDIYLSFFLGT